MNAIPLALKQAIGVGIGFFILFIGLVAAGIVKPGPPGVPVTLGELTAAPVAVAVVGLLLTLWLQARGTGGALLVGILVTTVIAVGVNAATGGRAFPIPGQAVIPRGSLGLARFLEPRRRRELRGLRARGRAHRGGDDLLDHALGLLRHHGHGDRHRGGGGLAGPERAAPAPQPRAPGGLAGGGGGRRRGRFVGHHLHRVGGRGLGGRAHGAGLGGDRALLPPRALLLAAGRRGAGPGHRARAADRGLPDDAHRARDPVRRHRGRAFPRSSPSP